VFLKVVIRVHVWFAAGTEAQIKGFLIVIATSTLVGN